MKFLFLTLFGFFSSFSLFAQQKSDNNAAIYQTGWVVHVGGQTIWIHSNFTQEITYKNFLKDTTYNDGINITGHYYATFLLKFAKSLKLDDLKPTEYLDDAKKMKLWIIPAEAKIVQNNTPDNDQDQQVDFEVGSHHTSIAFHNSNRISFQEIMPISKKDKKSVQKYLKSKGITIEDAINEQKSLY